TPASAALRLFISDVSPNVGRVLLVGNSWTESGITWNTAPSVTGAPELATFVPSSTGWIDIPLDASKLPSGGTYSVAVLNGGTNSTKFDSREGLNASQLVVQSP
ncbi:MAG: hypothetical protein H0X68_06050, partial [Chloroflexi bacterium]|nr:hypothetical protein [Chloroflexota bacterium]